jgi:hypothetical protein
MLAAKRDKIILEYEHLAIMNFIFSIILAVYGIFRSDYMEGDD